MPSPSHPIDTAGLAVDSPGDRIAQLEQALAYANVEATIASAKVILADELLGRLVFGSRRTRWRARREARAAFLETEDAS